MNTNLPLGIANLQWPQNGASGVHEEETQVTQDIGKGKKALCHQDGMEGVPVLSLYYLAFELQIEQTHSKTQSLHGEQTRKNTLKAFYWLQMSNHFS